jgi:hypothetical protein
MRGITFHASQIVAACKISLENFKFVHPQPSLSQSQAIQNPDHRPSTSQQSTDIPAREYDLCAFMKSYWDWLDACWTTLEAEELENGDYDFGVVPIIFQGRKNLRGLYGEEYRSCQKALAEHPARIPWAPELDENGQFVLSSMFFD